MGVRFRRSVRLFPRVPINLPVRGAGHSLPKRPRRHPRKDVNFVLPAAGVSMRRRLAASLCWSRPTMSKPPHQPWSSDGLGRFGILLGRNMLLFLPLLWCSYSRVDAATVTPSMSVTSRVVVREEPTVHSRPLGFLSPGDVAEVVQGDNGWVRVKLNDATVGFVSRRWVELRSEQVPVPPPPRQGKTAEELLFFPLMVAVVGAVFTFVVKAMLQRRAIRATLQSEMRAMVKEMRANRNYLAGDQHYWLTPGRILTQAPIAVPPSERLFVALLSQLHLLRKRHLTRIVAFYSHANLSEHLREALFQRVREHVEAKVALTEMDVDVLRLRRNRLLTAYDALLEVDPSVINSLPQSYPLPSDDALAATLNRPVAVPTSEGNRDIEGESGARAQASGRAG